jgi:plastocyanin
VGKRIIGLLVVLVAVVPGVAHSGGTDHLVIATATSYAPNQQLAKVSPSLGVITITQGDTLTLLNADAPTLSDHHDIVNDAGQPPFFSAAVGPGESAGVTNVSALPAGTYTFHCSFHSSVMKGTLVVQPPGGN